MTLSSTTMIKATLRALAFGICLSLCGHSAVAQDNNEPAGLKQTTKQVEPTSTTPQTANFSEEERVKALEPDAVARKFFEVEKAPADFPVYDEQSMTRERYRSMLREYAKAHPELVREKYKARLEELDK